MKSDHVMYRVLIATAVAAASLLTAPSSASAGEARSVAVIVRPGDSLSRIATRYGVTVADLKRWNPEKVRRADLIRSGDVLLVRRATADDAPVAKPLPGETWEGYYSIRSGDTLGKIARRLDVDVEDLLRWNRLRAGQAIKAGHQLKYVKLGKRPPAESVGKPTEGTLVGAVHLGKGKGYRLRFPRNAFGLPRMVTTLRACAGQVAERFPGTADVLIGDLSKPAGGRFPPHQSHQSGRDADVGYYLAGNKQNVTMHRVWPHDLDYAKNWEMLRCLIDKEQVVRVFMDTAIQKAFGAWLVEQGIASKAHLERLFEFASPIPEAALIRHAPKHDTHIHVRIACQEGDAHCSEEEGDQVFKL